MTAPPPESPIIRYGRVAFVVFHLLAITLVALPSVGSGMNRSAWKSPTVQEEFQTWAARVRGLGLDVTVEELEDFLWGFASGYEQARRVALRPMRPYLEYAETSQSWRMFVAPHRYPGRLVIEVDRGDGFELLYVARSAEHGWHRRWFDHDRMRAAIFRYAWRHYRSARNAFATWVAEQVAAEDPAAERVRVKFLRYRTLDPAQARAGVIPETKPELAVVRVIER